MTKESATANFEFASNFLRMYVYLSSTVVLRDGHNAVSLTLGASRSPSQRSAALSREKHFSITFQTTSFRECGKGGGERVTHSLLPPDRFKVIPIFNASLAVSYGHCLRGVWHDGWQPDQTYLCSRRLIPDLRTYSRLDVCSAVVRYSYGTHDFRVWGGKICKQVHIFLEEGDLPKTHDGLMNLGQYW